MSLIVGAAKTARLTDLGHTAKAAKAPAQGLAAIKKAPPTSFPIGVMAGDAEPARQGMEPGKVVLSNDHSQAVLWTKYKGAKKHLSVRIRRLHPTPRRLAYPQDKTATVKDGFVHFDARGLRPGTRYEYVFLEKSAGGKVTRSPVGQFRTPIAPNALEPVTFGGTSCTFQEGPRLKKTNRTLLAAAGRSDLAFFLHAGDQLYCDAPKEIPALKLKGYRKKYQQAFSKPGLKAVHKAFGMYTTWDDHEVFNGWQGPRDTAKAHGLNHVVSLQKNVMQIAKWGVRSFYEHQPIRKENRKKGKQRLWRSFRWGKTLEIFVLDCRNERHLKKHRYISEEQEKWLIDGLNNSEALFKFILNSRPIGYWTQKHRRKPKPNPERPKEDYRWTAPWVVEQRERIMKKARKVDGVWWLSGDVHFGTSGFADPDGKAPEKNVGEVVMGPGGQWSVKPDAPKKKLEQKIDWLREVANKKHMTFATLESNYVVIQVNPAEPREASTIDIYFYQGSKQRLHETRKYSGELVGKATANTSGGKTAVHGQK